MGISSILESSSDYGVEHRIKHSSFSVVNAVKRFWYCHKGVNLNVPSIKYTLTPNNHVGGTLMIYLKSLRKFIHAAYVLDPFSSSKSCLNPKCRFANRSHAFRYNRSNFTTCKLNRHIQRYLRNLTQYF